MQNFSGLSGLGINSKDFAPLVKKYPDKTIRKKIVNEDGEEIETEEIVPDYDAEPGYYLRYEGFAGIMIRYIQGLEQKDRELEGRIAALEKIINQGT